MSSYSAIDEIRKCVEHIRSLSKEERVELADRYCDFVEKQDRSDDSGTLIEVKDVFIRE